MIDKCPRFAKLFDFSCGFFSGFLVSVAYKTKFLGDLEPTAAILTGVVYSLPGFSINISVVDFTFGAVVSATSKLFQCFIVCFCIGLGLYCGITFLLRLL